MKVGILTFHRAFNYGAVLQCYALQQFLNSLGHDVEVIDYRQPWIEAVYKAFSISVFIHHIPHPKALLRYVVHYPKRRKVLKMRKQNFRTFLAKFIQLSPNPLQKIKDFPNNYDAYVIGSDQLWSKGCMGGNIDNIYLGNFAHSDEAKIVGYAISSDCDSIKKLYDEKRLKDSLNQFISLSFRESSISQYIQELTGMLYPATIDPTLLIDETLWKPLINSKWNKKNYVAVYRVRGGKEYTTALYSKAEQMKKQFGDCSIINLSDMSFDVCDFLSIIKFAKFVVTSSFHATVFSIIFKTPFYAVKYNDGRDGRYVSLCSALGLEKRCININSCVSEKDMDFSSVDMRLAALRQQSVSFITNSLR